MFRSIGSSLKRRQVSHQKSHNQLQIVSEAMNLFFKERIGIDMKGSGTRCVWSKETLEVYTGNKILANELSVRLQELTEFLKLKQVTPLQIIIR